MKLRNYFLGLFGLAAIGLATSCSNDDIVGGNEVVTPEGAPQFLTVKLASTGATRADYEYGDAHENAVKDVLFFFFKKSANGKSYVKAEVIAGGKNYFYWENPAEYDGTHENVEKELEATIVLNSLKGDDINKDHVIVAVVNPTEAGVAKANVEKMDDLRAILADYATPANAGGGYHFPMYNSSYAPATGMDNENLEHRITYSKIDGHIEQNQELARKNPVDIYVERCVAKVRVTFYKTKNDEVKVSLLDEYNRMPCVNTKSEPITDAAGNAIHLQITGWNVTAETPQGWLSKHIYPSWNSNASVSGFFGSDGIWNYPGYHRSFWAVNPDWTKGPYAREDNGYLYRSYDAIGGMKEYVYTNENAAEPALTTGDAPIARMQRKFPTQVIIAGQLCNSAGTAIDLAQYGGRMYAGADALKDAMAYAMPLYKKETVTKEVEENGVTKTVTGVEFVPIAGSDLVLETAKEDGLEDGQEHEGHYLVYPKLTEAAEALNWYASNTDLDAEPLGLEERAALVDVVGHGRVWTGGRTYYYFPIEHLAKSTGDVVAGQYGVVRNHVYDCNVSAIVGLGTPVYKSSEPIWPEKPEPDTDTYVAAKINILSWRVVPNNVTLNWGNTNVNED